MGLVDRLAEQRIAEAMKAGEFDDLPGRGQKVDFGEDDWVPQELRAAYRILKNSGFLPPQANMLREIADVDVLLARAETQQEQAVLQKKLNYLIMQSSLNGANSLLVSEMYYRRKLALKTEKKPTSVRERLVI